MAYIRSCKKCGQKISMREMKAGQWVAFDSSTDKAHKCGKKNKANPNIKILAKEKSKNHDVEGIDLGYSDTFEENRDSQLTEDNSYISSISSINKFITQAIKNKNRIWINYTSEFNKENTSREISPIKIFKYKNKDYLQSYCHLRRDQRSFLISSIQKLNPLDTKMFKPKNLTKPNIADFAEKFNKLSSETLENEYLDNVPPKVGYSYKVEKIIDEPVVEKVRYNKPVQKENKQSFFNSWLWYLMLAVWGFGILNYLLGCPFASCD